MGARSKRLAGPLTLTSVGNPTIYTCPAGKVALVKQVRMVAQAAVGTGVQMFVNGTLAANFVGRYTVPASGHTIEQADSPLVLHEGDTLRLGMDGAAANVTVTVSGAELDA
jgi:hypothetical protein